jgi:hypothetical protein
MRRLLAVAVLSSLAGCSLDSEGIGALEAIPDGATSTGDTSVPGEDVSFPADATQPDDAAREDVSLADGTSADTPADAPVPDTLVPDTLAMDTSVADTFVADTFVADTFVADTFVADTFVADTFVADTFVADTFVADTLVADTAPRDAVGPDVSLPDATRPDGSAVDAGAMPALGCTTSAPTAAVVVNLTSDGTIDWAHWGYASGGASLGSFQHKAGAASAIGAGTVIGTALASAGYPTRFSWTNGTPTPSASNSTDGEYVSKKDDGFAFDVEGDPLVERTLTAYFASNGATGTLDASLSDGSAKPYATTVPPMGATLAGIQPLILTCKFRPAAAGAKLVVTLLQTSGSGDVSRLAATLR